MAKRDEYVERVKKRLDDWNADIRRLEDAYDKAEHGARHRLQEQIQSLRRHREEAQEQVRRIEDAAEEVWHEIAKGAEEAWKLIGDVFSGHRSTRDSTAAEAKPEAEPPAEEIRAEESPAEEAPAVKAPPKTKSSSGKASKKSTVKSA